MLTDDVKKRIYEDALSAEAELIERDLTVETVRDWFESMNDSLIEHIRAEYIAAGKETRQINVDAVHRMIGTRICAYLDQCIMDAAAFQVGCKIDEIYAEAERK